MSAPVIPGAEAISIPDGERGGVLLLHGYMGTVQTIRNWALAFGQAGFAVEAPLLPGHGTTVEEMAETRWSDYLQCAEDFYQQLAARHQRIFIGGLCTGSNLAVLLAARHPEKVAGVISINGFFKVPKHWNPAFMDDLLKSNRKFLPWWNGKSVEDPDAPPLITYEQSPIMPMMSLKGARIDSCQCLSQVMCPVLVFTSQLSPDFVLDEKEPWYADVAGPVEDVRLERSNHLATLDYDKELVEERSTTFALAIVQGEKPAHQGVA